MILFIINLADLGWGLAAGAKSKLVKVTRSFMVFLDLIKAMYGLLVLEVSKMFV
jgi:hypothetical protein